MTLLIGQTEDTTPGIGFNAPAAAQRRYDIVDDGDAGLVTIAATGAGKGVSQVIPNLLVYPGSAVVIDIKGEIAAVTARRRREMGQDVYILDPFASSKTDFIDPFDLMRRRHHSLPDDCRMLASMMAGQARITTDPYWDDRARDMVTGSLLFIAEHVPDHQRSLPLVQKFWTADTRRIAEGLSIMRESPFHDGLMGRYANQFIDAPERTRASIHSSIHNQVEFLSSPMGQRGLGPGARGRKVDLEGFTLGRPMTIYLTVPPAFLASHGALLRVWIGTLLAAAMRRERIPARPTLFLVDEAAQLGHLDQLLTAATLMRGYGLRVWTFWQSLAQMERIYGTSARELLDNAGTVSVFGMGSAASAGQLAALTGWTGDPFSLGTRRQIVCQTGRPAVSARKVSYLRDPRFRGMFDPNPFHADKSCKREGVR